MKLTLTHTLSLYVTNSYDIYHSRFLLNLTRKNVSYAFQVYKNEVTLSKKTEWSYPVHVHSFYHIILLAVWQRSLWACCYKLIAFDPWLAEGISRALVMWPLISLVVLLINISHKWSGGFSLTVYRTSHIPSKVKSRIQFLSIIRKWKSANKQSCELKRC